MTGLYLLIPFGALLLAFLIKMPLGFGMIIGGIAYLIAKGQNVGMLVNNINMSLYSAYILIAIPLFVFTADVMNSSYITDKIFKFCNGIARGARGATAYVNVLASLIFAGMTGSAIADAAGLGILEIEQMKKEGYDVPFSCAITAASAIIGPIFPPSIPLVIYAMVTGASIGKLFLGGMVPAFIIAILLMLYVRFITRKRNYPSGLKTTLRQFLLDTLSALPALLTPVVLLTGIYTGIMTPTEAAAIAGAYVLIISLFVYRTMTLQKLYKVLKNTITTTGSLCLIIAGAYVFSYIVTVENLGKTVETLFYNLNVNRNIFLIIVNLFFLLLGGFVDVNVSQLVFLPIFTPLLYMYNIDLVHFGVMITLNMMIGLLTPPFGMLLFITSGIGKCDLKDLIKEVTPMVCVLIVALAIITFFPETVLFATRFLK